MRGGGGRGGERAVDLTVPLHNQSDTHTHIHTHNLSDLRVCHHTKALTEVLYIMTLRSASRGQEVYSVQQTGSQDEKP